jgi:hypothetical protein
MKCFYSVVQILPDILLNLQGTEYYLTHEFKGWKFLLMVSSSIKFVNLIKLNVITMGPHTETLLQPEDFKSSCSKLLSQYKSENQLILHNFIIFQITEVSCLDTHNTSVLVIILYVFTFIKLQQRFPKIK